MQIPDEYAHGASYEQVKQRVRSRQIMNTAKRIKEAQRVDWLKAVRMSLEENGVFEKGRRRAR